MKHAVLATLVALTGFTPVLRAQGPDPVNQRLMQIDLDVATRHYEKLQGLLRDAKLEQMVGQSSGLGEGHAEQVKLARKIEVISQLSEETRVEILKLGQTLEESGAKLESPSPYKRGKRVDSAPAATGSAYAPSTAVVPGASTAQAAAQARPPIVVQPQTLMPPAIEATPAAGLPPGAMPGAAATPVAPLPVPVPPTPVAPAVPGVPGAANPPLPPTAEPQQW